MQNGIKLWISLLLTLSATLSAQEVKSAYSIAILGMNMDYREYDNAGNILDSEKSKLYDTFGFEFGYSFFLLKKEDSYSKLDMSVMYINGSTDYVGSTLNSGNLYGSVVSTTVNDIIDTDLSWRQYNILNQKITLNYGLGIGYKYWRRALSANQVEVYDWFSLRPQVGLDWNFNKQIVVKTEVEYQYGINPTMTANNIGSDFNLGSADIWQATLGLNYRINERIDIFTDLIFEQQTINRSDVVTDNGIQYYEPDSTAYNQYLKFGVTFKY